MQMHCKRSKEHTPRYGEGWGMHVALCDQRTGEEWQQMRPGPACEGPLTAFHPLELGLYPLGKGNH